MKANEILTVEDLMKFKNEILEAIKKSPQPPLQSRFVCGKTLGDIVDIKSYTALQSNFGQFSQKIGGKLLFDLEEVIAFLKKK